MRTRVQNVLCFSTLFLLLLLTNDTAVGQQTTKRDVSYQGVSFAYDPSLARDVAAVTILAQRDPNLPYWLQLPAHIKFRFDGYVAPSNFSLDTGIYIFPAELERDLPEHTGKLRALLLNRPDLRSVAPQEMTFLPPINAASIPVGKQEYKSFRNGSGLRFITHLAQDVSPIENEELLYNYMGLTNDGKYYVAAVFPAPLSASAAPPAWNPADDIAQYNNGVRAQVQSASSRDFVPNLDNLDEMMASLNVDSTQITLTAVPGMPRTGAAGDAGFRPSALAVALLALLCGIMLAVKGHRRLTE